VTDDELVSAAHAQVAGRQLPVPATARDGGFGPWPVVSLTESGDCADITMAYRQFTAPDEVLPSGIVPLMDRG